MVTCCSVLIFTHDYSYSDKTSEEIAHQGDQQKVNHDELLKDLEAIRQRAKDVWDKIGEVLRVL